MRTESHFIHGVCGRKVNLERRGIVFTDPTKINWLKKRVFSTWNEIRKRWNVIWNTGFQKKGYKVETLLFVGDLQKCRKAWGNNAQLKWKHCFQPDGTKKNFFLISYQLPPPNQSPEHEKNGIHCQCICHSNLNVRRKWKLEWGSRVQGQE